MQRGKNEAANSGDKTETVSNANKSFALLIFYAIFGKIVYS